MSSHHFRTDHGRLEIQIEGDHLWINNNDTGYGESMTDPDEIRALRSQISILLDRLDREVNVSQR